MANNTGLAQFLLKRWDEWDKNWKTVLGPKLEANLAAIQNKDDPSKKPFKHEEGIDWRSDVNLPIIKTKIFALYSMICDIILKGDTLQFGLKRSPYEEELNEADEPARQKWEKDKQLMEDKIKEQLQEFKAIREKKKKLLGLLTYGRCWSKFDKRLVKIKTYAPVMVASQWEEPQEEATEWARQVIKKQVPGHRYISIWNIRWDMETENIQEGSGIAERMFDSVYGLRQLKKKQDEFYIPEHIQKVIDEHKHSHSSGDDMDSVEPGIREFANRKKGIRRIGFWIRAPRKNVEEFEDKISQMRIKKGRNYLNYDPENFDLTTVTDDDESGDDVEIMAEVAGEEVIRFARVDPGIRPFKTAVAEITLDDSVAWGIGDNLKDMAYIGIGLWRAFLDNARLQANVILATKRRMFADPGKADDPITPGWRLEVSESCDDARKALAQVTIQDTTGGLINGMGINDKHIDRFSMLPEILQGSVLPKQKPDTAYELSQLMENATRYVGSIVKNDDELTEDEIKDLYDYNMDDPEVKGKGNYTVYATGFATFQKKVVQLTVLKQLLVMSLADPELRKEIKNRAHLEVIYEDSELDPDDFLKSEKEKLIEQKAMAQIQAEAALGAQQQAAQAQAMQLEQDTTKIAAKGKVDSDLKEQDFQREIIKKAMDASQPQKETQGGTENVGTA